MENFVIIITCFICSFIWEVLIEPFLEKQMSKGGFIRPDF